ncbi:MAG: 16S rRNA (cytosine(1402)-N(4))-methyltransferase RsmH [Candidatus Omnitrophica bacterium]|jgi:16S rRNA (cytosine1402-N4)-methyltransferase|nr:16S rRNA (cytosine(1402)-N(4))-methyltransferase RsmH [Candidatus Omnitrophota bacterium]
MEIKYHNPVMLEQVLEYLGLSEGKVIVDATVGTAGHSSEIIKRIGPSGKLICIDKDSNSLKIAAERLSDYQNNCVFIHSNFVDLDKVLLGLAVQQVDGIILDLGVSSYQLDDPARGFSFSKDGPLDMRLDQDSYISAYDLVNNLNEEELSGILRNFGQERWHNRIARFLVQERQKHPIATTAELSRIVLKAVPYRGHQRIHPATRTFQAVRIAVNRELEILGQAIVKAIGLLRKNGRIAVISFHSLEDRIVKLAFREKEKSGLLKIITRKPLEPSWEQIKGNRACRSAKLRVAERI